MVNCRGCCLGRKPHFFKILIGDYENKLRIPEPFIKHFPEGSQSSHQAILEGPSGSCWHVRLNITTKGMYIQDGWGTFLKDHSLQKHDFLVFRYDGNMHFTVKVFDTSACQRRDAFTVKPSTKSKQRVECILSLSSKQVKKMTVGERKALKAAVSSLSSDFPRLVLKLHISNVVKPLNLTIPVKFARKYLPNEDSDLTLQTEEGSWLVHCYVRPSQYAFCGGWNTFVHDNDLKEGDYCIFQLIRELVMNVYFHRC